MPKRPTVVNNPELGRLVRERRKELKRTTRDVAQRAKLDPATLLSLEKGYYAQPTPATLMAISRELDLPLYRLYKASGYFTPYDLVELATSQDAKDEIARARAEHDRLDEYFGRIVDNYQIATDPSPQEFENEF